MRLNISLSIISTIVLTSSVSATYTTSHHADKKTFRTPITRLRRPDPVISSIQKRHNLEKRDPFMASLYNDAGSQYLIDVSIGTPAQNFTVTLDTGSADLWVPGSSCPSEECPNSVFNGSQSSTFKLLNEPFSLVYGIGSVNGTYATDTVSISGATVKNQQFGLASTTQQILTNPNTITASIAENDNTTLAPSKDIKTLATSASTPVGNGILGIGYPRLTAASSEGEGVYNPFVFNLVSQNVISDPVFSIYLNSAKKTGWAGEILFGGVDSSKYDGNITYLPVLSLPATRSSKRDSSNNYYYWMVGAQGISVKNTSSTNATSSNNSIVDINFTSTSAYILDTGTTLTYFPSEIARQLVETVAGVNGYTTDASSGAYLIDCSAAKSEIEVVLKMSATGTQTANPVTLSIPASQLVIPLDATSADDASFCLFGIAPTSGVSSSSSNLHLVGDSVLRSAYMVFDMGNNRIGLAAAVGVEGSVQGVSSTAYDHSTSGSLGKLNQNPATPALLACLLMAILAF